MAIIGELILDGQTVYHKTITNAVANVTEIRDEHILNRIIEKMDNALTNVEEKVEIFDGDDSVEGSIVRKINDKLLSAFSNDKVIDKEFVTAIEIDGDKVRIHRSRPQSTDIERESGKFGIEAYTLEGALNELHLKIKDNIANNRQYKIVPINNDEYLLGGWKLQVKTGEGVFSDVLDSTEIKVFRQPSIENIYIGNTDDTINQNNGIITSSISGEKSLNFVYIMRNGKYSLIKIKTSDLYYPQINEDITSSVNIGSIKVGDTIQKGTTITDIFKKIFTNQ